MNRFGRFLRLPILLASVIAGVVRKLVDSVRFKRPNPSDDPLIRYLLDEPPAKGKRPSSVTTIDQDLYGR